jgi:hypothetical protein
MYILMWNLYSRKDEARSEEEGCINICLKKKNINICKQEEGCNKNGT